MDRKFSSISLVSTVLLSMMVGTWFIVPTKGQWGEPPIELYSSITLDRNYHFAGDGFIIKDHGLILDLNGYNITGSGTGTGILNMGMDGVSIKNYGENASFIENFERGIELKPLVDGATYNWPEDCDVGPSTPWILNYLTIYQDFPCIVVANNYIGMYAWFGGEEPWGPGIVMPTIGSIALKSNTYGLLLEGTVATFAITVCDNEYGIYGEGFDGVIAFSIVDLNSVGMSFFNSNPWMWANRILGSTDVGLLMNSSSVQLPWVLVWINDCFVGAFNVHEWWNLLKGNGIGVALVNSNNNIICNWGMINNTIGLDLNDSNDNLFYHNNFINNTNHVRIQNSANTAWDNGYPLGGNYWSDYNETYPDAKQLDGSGIWDTPYVIDENNQDNYPLVTKYFPGDLNHNNKIDIYDVVMVCKSYFAKVGDPDWDPRADLNVDGVINIYDVVLICAHYDKEDCMGED